MICARRAAVALSCLATALTVAGVTVLVLRFRRSRMAALRLAQAAYARSISHPDDLRASTNYYRCLARLVKWFDALPVKRRAEACRDAGLVVEMDQMEEIRLFRFTVAEKVPLYRLTRSHMRSGIGVPVVAWRPNDGSDRWDTLRPLEGIFAPATAVLAREDAGRWALRFLSPYSRETVIVWKDTPTPWPHTSARP